jgi:hypothetical protein
MCFQRIISLLFLWLAVTTAGAQVISGHIANDTGVPVNGASIYYDGTSIGAVSDKNGYFAIKALVNSRVPLIISCIGYQLKSISPPFSTSLEIRLLQRVTQLNAVVIGNEGMSREQKLNWFRKEFLGLPADRKGCAVTNENDLFLSYDKESTVLTASAEKSLQIDNPYLGYRIRYGLNFFGSSMSPQRTVFDGSQFFEELPATPKERAVFLERRKKAYLGSKMHFIRSLWNGTLRKESFAVIGPTGAVLPDSAYTAVDTAGRRYLLLTSRIRIIYGKELTAITPKEPGVPIYIDSKGFFDPSKVKWSGAMAIQRIAALLPFDYDPEEE